MSGGLVARLRAPLRQRADFSEILAGSWTALSPSELSRRPVYLEDQGVTALGELFDLTGDSNGRIRFTGDLELADRLGAGMSGGDVVVEGNVGAEAGISLAGGSLLIEGDAGPRAGAAPPGFKRGMTGGELVVRGSAGAEAGSAMRRGLVAIVGRAGDQAGLGMIAGTIVTFGTAGANPGLWSKRGSFVALGGIDLPPTYAYACTYQPVHLKLMLTRLRDTYGLPVKPKHLNGFYRRYSGDLAELGKGEILSWSPR
jgi:formylmethanofuran dehydrogenase subunit C